MSRREFWLWRRNDDGRRDEAPGGPLQGDQKTSTRAPEDPPPLLRHHSSRRELERRRQATDYELAWRVQDIFVKRGLTCSRMSMAGGYSLHIPEVISVTSGPPTRLDIRTLPGQRLDDFIAHAPEIAHDLGVAEVRVVALGPSLISLELGAGGLP